MGKRDKQKAKIEEDEEGETPSKSAAVVISSDDDEANEDLSLKIVEKSLSKRAVKSSPDQFVVVDVDSDDGMVGGAVDRDSTASQVIEAVVDPSESNVEPVVVVPEVEAGSKSKRKSRKERKERKKSKAEKVEMKENTVVANEGDKVEAVKATDTVESADPNVVQISDNVVLRKLLRGPRYFDPPDSSWGTCYNCGEEGHTAVNCTVARRKKPCFVCGSFEHGVRNCTKGHDCFICKKSGHRAKDCPDKYKKLPQSSQMCLKCGDSGHEMYSCRNEYSPDDLKEIQCYVCKRFGHLCCINSADTGSRDISCYKCGQLGHTGLACNRLHGETTYTAAASPSSCYRCGEGGHFARECTSSAKIGKRNREFSTPVKRFPKEDADYLGIQSAPNELGKARKKKKARHEERGVTTPRKSKHIGGWNTEDPRDSRKSKHRGGWSTEDPGDSWKSNHKGGWSTGDPGDQKKSKHRGGWITEDPGDSGKSKHRGGWITEDPGDSGKSKHRGGWSTEDPGDYSHRKFRKTSWMSPATPPTGNGHKISSLTAGGHVSSSRSPKKTWKHHSENSPSQGSANVYNHRYSASRFSNSNNYGNSNNDGSWRRYDW